MTAALLAFAGLVGAATGASGTSVLALSDAQKVGAADAIVRGVVTSATPRWDEARRLIVTDVEVAVARRLKGQGGATLALRQLGGTLDGQTLAVPGTPRLEPGAEVLLLLVAKGQAGGHVVLGLNQGAYVVRRDQGAPARVVALGDHAHRVGRAEPGARFLPLPGQALPLAQVEAAIARAVRR